MSKQFNRREFEELLVKNGYVLERKNGGHNIWRRNNQNVVIPRHKLNFMIAKRLIKENNLTK